MSVQDVMSIAAASAGPRILVTGVGNVLRQDDGFGVAVVRCLLDQRTLPSSVSVLETGIAGIRLVQELIDGYEALIVVDAMKRGGTPGEVFVLEAEVPDITTFSLDQRHEFLADMHYTNPTRAMMLAKALDVLPRAVYLVGCEPARYDDFALGLSPEVEAAVPVAAQRILRRIELLQAGFAAAKNVVDCSGTGG